MKSNLCCVLSPKFICKECKMQSCEECWQASSQTTKGKKILWHEENNNCSAGANKCHQSEGSMASAVYTFTKI